MSSSIAIAILLSVLGLTDCVLCGFRASIGREGRLDKSSFYKKAALRSFGAGVVVIAAHAILAAILITTARDPESVWQSFVTAGRVCAIVYAAYAAAVFLAFGFFFAPIGDFRVLTNVIVFGPFTLARPWVIAGGLIAGVLSSPDPRVIVVALSAGIAILSFQRMIDRPYANRWRRLVE
jgi:hypothetical protein